MFVCARFVAPAARTALVSGSRAYLRPLSTVVTNHSSSLSQQNLQTPTSVSLLPAVRNFQTTAITRDIDSAAKFIGAGAATVGVAGSGANYPPPDDDARGAVRGWPEGMWHMGLTHGVLVTLQSPGRSEKGLHLSTL
uniref:Uncharacterized protein n=1 Tax=Timema genevievae TaxID=629358 RepID=A0A7R9JRA5_TIMGE|nr:unnamed protein product [Timema genevievae]